MGKGDALASGQKKATFAMGGDSKDAPITLRNVAPETDEIVSHVDNSAALFSRKKPSVFYKGKPLGDMVLVERIKHESNSLVIIPDSAKGKSDVGRVTGVGHKAPSVHEGDLVLFDKFAAVGMEVSLLDASGEEREHLVLREHDILLILEEVRPAETLQ